MEEEIDPCLVSVFMFQTFRRKAFVSENMPDLFPRIGHVPCGSAAEFYMTPILSCVDDRDFLHEVPAALAFHDDLPSLPDYVRNLDENICCLLIKPYSSYPAFVRLQFLGELKYDWGRKKYEFVKARMKKNERRFYSMKQYKQSVDVSNYERYITVEFKGPAVRSKMNFQNIQFDEVLSVFCPQWPKGASDWPSRPRKCGWPTEDVILEVVRRGCHLVNVQHRDCGGDEYQWRLSFSVAEVLLINSWTPVQQIVYHMLRFFAKRELIQKDCSKEKEVLCPYHLKTLMLWTCEKESLAWWNSNSLIELCCNLLRKLSDWLNKRCCPNYFIPEANLFYESTDLESHKAIIERVNYFCDSRVLSQWFLGNYILTCFCKITGSTETTLSPLEIVQFADQFPSAHNIIKPRVLDRSLVATHFLYITKINELNSEMIVCREMNEYAIARIRSPDVVSQLHEPTRKELNHFESSLLLLASSNAISCRKVTHYSSFTSDTLRLMSLGFVPDWWFQYHNFPQEYESRFQKSFVYFLRAQESLGNFYGCLSNAEFELRCRMSMNFLSKSIRSEDSSSDAVRSAAVVYAAAICYAKSQYQASYDLCLAVLTDESSAPASDMLSVNIEPMNAGCLLFSDDVARIVGFLVLFQNVSETNLTGNLRNIDLDLRISPNVFAQYILLQLMERMTKHSQINWSGIRSVFLFDASLLAIMKSRLSDVGRVMNSDLCIRKLCPYRRCNSPIELVEGVTELSLTEDICVRLFMECSLEKLDCFYKAVFQQFCVQGNTVVRCFRALYLYKYRKYEETMILCEEILHESDFDVDPEKVAFLNVVVYPPFLVYFDDDIQCVIGLQLICHFLDLLQMEFMRRKVETLALWMKNSPKKQPKLVVVGHILTKETFRFQYILTKHFVARYLKLRCLIDCKSSVSEIRRAIGEINSRLPLEHLIRQFLLRKLQQVFKIAKQ